MMITKYLESQPRHLVWGKLSKAQFIELAVLKVLDEQGKLQPYLQEFGVDNAEIENIRLYLQRLS